MIRTDSGFSLVELMVVLAIVGLLSTLAYPAYANYWVHVKRVEGRLALLNLSTRLEAYAMTTEQGYLGASLEGLGINAQTENRWYSLGIEELEEGYYRLSATPVFTDNACSELSCNSRGQYTYQGSGSYSDCWGGY